MVLSFFISCILKNDRKPECCGSSGACGACAGCAAAGCAADSAACCGAGSAAGCAGMAPFGFPSSNLKL